jgi:hypothetical protein
MGKIFEFAEEYLPKVNDNSVFVEIGSDHWEGSTNYFANLAMKHHTVLHTVDIDPDPQNRLKRLPSTVWHCQTGSTWVTDVFPTIDKKIACLYLDNFDYDWETTKSSDMIEEQKLYIATSLI